MEAICSRPKADCSKGFSISGVSQGAQLGLIGATLPGLAYPITALTSFSNGWVGGSGHEACWKDADVSAHLPRTRRRYVGTAADTEFGDFTPGSILQQHKEMS